ncbi:hypothetical protein HDA32_000009 [Spinactinospora alkalitolerans]|uniref:Uncharacterized protein n=1 Tax=Spinactinospora alkalitolerans TaxID=687207 RepID=A0A852TLQ2_9ACTN|nr:hypothetical protein [Spinactinospora alkalitolerans]NYE44889.1 hypothetical protein [Spinactinospora alkalitolerans]
MNDTDRPPDGVDETIVSGLLPLLRKGLPVVPDHVEPRLLDLRGVIVRAADPADPASLATALDGVLRAALARFDDARYAEAARALFGLPPGRPGTTLTARRAAAAAAAGHEVHHFRKRVEPRLVDRLAWMLQQDAEQFGTTRVAAPRLTPAGAPPQLPRDVFAWELTEHEEQLARVWAAIYALRSELLALDRMASMGEGFQEISRQAVTAAWRYGLLRAEAERYRGSYPPGSFGALGDLSVDDVVALAGWVPPLKDEHITKLTRAGADHPDRAAFVAVMRAEVELGNTWSRPWLDHRNENKDH